jgi:hypothetical protein
MEYHYQRTRQRRKFEARKRLETLTGLPLNASLIPRKMSLPATSACSGLLPDKPFKRNGVLMEYSSGCFSHQPNHQRLHGPMMCAGAERP